MRILFSQFSQTHKFPQVLTVLQFMITLQIAGSKNAPQDRLLLQESWQHTRQNSHTGHKEVSYTRTLTLPEECSRVVTDVWSKGKYNPGAGEGKWNSNTYVHISAFRSIIPTGYFRACVRVCDWILMKYSCKELSSFLRLIACHERNLRNYNFCSFSCASIFMVSCLFYTSSWIWRICDWQNVVMCVCVV